MPASAAFLSSAAFCLALKISASFSILFLESLFLPFAASFFLAALALASSLWLPLLMVTLTGEENFTGPKSSLYFLPKSSISCPMLSAFFIYNAKGETLISHVFREGVRLNVGDVFRVQVISKLSDIKSPVLTLGSTSFLHIRSGTLWIVAVARDNADVSMLLEFLYRFVDLLKKLLVADDDVLTEQDITNNFVPIYEILAKIIDYGYVQSWSDLKLDSDVTKRQGKSTERKFLSFTRRGSQAVARQPGIKYKKNELVLTVTEELTLLMSSNGSLVRSFAEGTITANSQLSGEPVCSFRMVAEDDETQMTDCNFHNCVNLQDFDRTGLVSFTPPDGEFELMRYHAQISHLPFVLTANDHEVVLKADFPPNYTASVNVQIPIPPGTTDAKIDTPIGKAKFDAQTSSISWRIKKLNGGKVCNLTMVCDGNTSQWSRPPIHVSFDIDGYSSTKYEVQRLRVQENYRTVKVVNYSTRDKSYEFRM